MLALGDTVQGERGWYQGDQNYYKWDVTEEHQWVKLHGPVDKEEFRKLLDAEEAAGETSAERMGYDKKDLA